MTQDINTASGAAMQLADQYAAAHAKWALEDLYGTSKSYTAKMLKERHALRSHLAAALASAAAPAEQPAPSAAAAGAALPEGWVPLVIMYEGQYPEEIAYGPKILMARLEKWLRKYFDHVVASKAQTAPAADAPTVSEGRYGFWVTHLEHDPDGFHNGGALSEREKAEGWTEVALTVAPQPPITPQADSQPAPMLPESLTLAVNRWFAENMGLGGCSDKDVRELAELFYGVAHAGGRESVDDALAIVESFGPGIGGLNDTYARQILLAEEVKRLRAARAQADSVTAPAGEAVAEVVMAIRPPKASPAWLPHKIIHASLQWLDSVPVGTKLYATPPAQAADSVLEDAARYRHLRDCNSGSLAVMQITGTGEDDWYILTEDAADAAVDAARKHETAAMAAKKGGE